MCKNRAEWTVLDFIVLTPAASSTGNQIIDLQATNIIHQQALSSAFGRGSLTHGLFEGGE
jgi:hypothetical protein